MLGLVVVAALLAAAAGGVYLVSRQEYFIGTNAQAIITVYRGLPYQLPFGIRLYRPYYISGAPLSLVPPERRAQLLDNQLRSRTDAMALAHAAELGQIAR